MRWSREHLRWLTRPVRDCMGSDCVAAMVGAGMLKERLGQARAGPHVCKSLYRQPWEGQGGAGAATDPGGECKPSKQRERAHNMWKWMCVKGVQSDMRAAGGG